MPYINLRELIKIRLISMPNQLWDDSVALDKYVSRFVGTKYIAKKALFGEFVSLVDTGRKRTLTLENLLFDTVSLRRQRIPEEIRRIVNE